MNTAKKVDSWRNGDNALVLECELSTPLKGNEVVQVVAWRAIGGRFVTAVTDKKGDFLSDSLDGQRRHKDALASVGYQLFA